MAIVKTGNALTTAKWQANANVSNDGYGLLTSSVTWTGDKNGNPPKKGSDHPVFSFMKAWKITREYGNGELTRYKVDYVGICSEDAGTGAWTSATTTVANISGSVTLQTEKVQSHPHFFDATVPMGGADDLYMIAGHGTGTASAPNYPASTIVPGKFVGLNGAHFDDAKGTTFIGFKDPAYPQYFGRTNYLAPSTGLSGIIYTSDDAIVQRFLENIGHSSLVQGWASGPKLVPDFVGTDFEGPYGGQLLLAAVAFEEYGHVYKCSYQVRINKDGWPQAAYPLFV